MTLIEEIRTIRSLPPPHRARQIRVLSGVTQQRLADEIEVHRVTLAKWEAGAAVPRGEARLRYAQVLAELQRELAS